jgi:hypothetical protein
MTCRAILLHAAAAAVPLLPAAAHAQTSYGRDSPYDQAYGEPVDVSVSDLDQSPEAYLNKAVRTRGSLDLETGQRNQFTLRDSLGATVKIVPLEEIREHFQRNQVSMIGRDVEVTGVVKPMGDDAAATRRPGLARVQIQFWSYLGPPDTPPEDALKKAAALSLENLLTSPGQRDGQLVRVVGRFRGSNLYGDLPHKSRRARGDWVIKDETFAVWVTGKKPRGKGFDLDPSLKSDADKWIEVVGRPISRAGVTWIQAVQVTLTGPPRSPTVPVPAASAAAERPRVPAVIVFTMPLDGAEDVGADARFTVQFSKDMDESSFRDRVVLRYAGGARPGDPPITNMTVTYDAGPRTLVVDPGMMLAPGRPLELLLLPGIVDAEGLPLAPRAAPAPPGDGIVEILRYSTGS